MSLTELQQKLDDVVSSLGTAKFDVPTVSRDEIVRRMQSKDPSLVLLDTRTEEERITTIPGSIDVSEFEGNIDKYKDKEVVCFCTVGYLSAAKACEYRRKGMSNVKNFGNGALLGFTLAQTASGNTMPLVNKDGQPSNEVHTFMPDLAPLAGQGMVAKSFADPGAVLEAANAKIAEILDL